MSLATGGGLGGSGALGGALSTAAMAHGGPAAHRSIAKPSQTHSQIPGGGGGGTAAPGTSFAAIGADLLDKNQSFVTAKNVRATSKLPIVAMDIYGDKTCTSYFPPLPKDESDGNEDEMEVMMKNMNKLKKGVLVRSVNDGTLINGTNVTLKKDDGNSYKAMKKYLNKGEGIGNVLKDALVVDGSSSNDDENVIVIERPHLLMGTRKLSDLNTAAKSTFQNLLPSSTTTQDEDSNTNTAIIDAADDVTNKTSISLTTIALDGQSQQPKHDDYDRVVYQMKLNSKKKVMTILPEEALSIIIATCKKNVRDAYCINEPESELNNYGLDKVNEEEEEDDESYMDYPPAFAIPGWATLDPAIEALIDAAKGGGGNGSSSSCCGPSLHQRSIAACVGALLSPPTKSYKAKSKKATNGLAAPPSAPASSKLCNLLTETMSTKNTDAAKEAAKVAALARTDPIEPDPFVPLVIMVGATKEGIELTAVQITKPQRPEDELHCPFGNISVISSVCYATANSKNDDDDDVDSASTSMLESTLNELRKQIGITVPESEEPTAFVTYGTTDIQSKLSTNLKETLKKYGKDGKDDENWDGWDEDITILATKDECVSNGLAVLAASVHGRVRLIVSHKGTDGKMRPKAKIGVSVQDVATCAVAISFNYFGGDADKWTTPKVIFDFDRRVPAGPYQTDLTAAECAAHVRHVTTMMKKKAGGDACIEDVDALMELASKLEGSKGIAEREAAALQLRFRIYQKTVRGGKWMRVGDDSRPLTMLKDVGESGEDNLVALESTVLEISLSTVGIISTGLITNGETIVQATKSARNSKLLRWGGILGSILFIGGFLVKSFVEERIFERDTHRVLAYYKHAAPNSFHDGDERHARYMVWKYKGKKDKLWRRLEAKYNIPVKHAWEWEDEEETNDNGKKEEEEAEDLDDGTEKVGESDEL